MAREFTYDTGRLNTFNRRTQGLVPAPGGSGTTRYLREDGSWFTPPGTGGGGGGGTTPSDTITPVYLFSAARRLTSGTNRAGELYRADAISNPVGTSTQVLFDANGLSNIASAVTFLAGQVGYWGSWRNNAAGYADFFQSSAANAIANSPIFNPGINVDFGFNGRASLDCNGSRFLSDLNAPELPSANLSAHFALMPRSATAGQTLFFCRGASDSQMLILSWNADNGQIGWQQNGVWRYADVPAALNGGLILSFILSEENGGMIAVNGQPVRDGLPFTKMPLYDAMRFGASFGTVGGFNGLLAEAQILQGAQGTADWQETAGNMGEFFRIRTPRAQPRTTLASTSDLIVAIDRATGLPYEVPASQVGGGPGGGSGFDPSTSTALAGLFGTTVALPINRLLGHVLYPEQFGAVGDGVTDDTVALNRWAQACITFGKTATAEPGAVYLFTDTIKFLNPNGLDVLWPASAKLQSGFFPSGYDLSQDTGGNILFLSTTTQTLKAAGNRTLREIDGLLDNLNAGVRCRGLNVNGASFAGHSQPVSGINIVDDGFGVLRALGRNATFVNPQEVFVPVYTDGTVNLTFNSNIVQGVGTLFTSSGLVVGSQIRFASDPRPYYIKAIDTNTQIRLDRPYRFATQTAVTYQAGYTQVVHRLYQYATSGTAGNRPVKGTGTGLAIGTATANYVRDVRWLGSWRRLTDYLVDDYLFAFSGELVMCVNPGRSSQSNPFTSSADQNTRIGANRYIERKVQVGKATITNDGPGGVGRVVLTGSPALLTAAAVGDWVRFGYTASANTRCAVSGSTLTGGTGFSSSGNASVGDQVRLSDDDTPYTISAVNSDSSITLSSAPPATTATIAFNIRGSNRVYQIASITSNNEFVLTEAYQGQLTSDVHCTIGGVVWRWFGNGLRPGDDGICIFGGTRVVMEDCTTSNFLDSHRRTPRSTVTPNATRFEEFASHNNRWVRHNCLGGISPHSTTDGGTCDHLDENPYISTHLAQKSASRQLNSFRMHWQNVNIRHLSIYPAIEIQGYANSSRNGVVKSDFPRNFGAGMEIVTNGGATYSVGSASFTNGSAVVAGASTNWLSNAKAGDSIRLGTTGPLYTILSVDTDTQLTLTAPYQESPVTGQAYRMIRRDYDMVNTLDEWNFEDFDNVIRYTLTDNYRSENQIYDIRAKNFVVCFNFRGGADSVFDGLVVPSTSVAKNWLGTIATDSPVQILSSDSRGVILRRCKLNFLGIEGTVVIQSNTWNVNPWESFDNEILLPVSVDFLTATWTSGGRPLNNQSGVCAGTRFVHRNPAVGDVAEWSCISGGRSDTDKWNVGLAAVTNGSTAVTLSGLTGVASNSIAANDYIRIDPQNTPIRIAAITINTGAATADVTLATPWLGGNGSNLLFHVNPAWQWRATRINGQTRRRVITGTSYTLTQWDIGALLVFTSSSAVTVTLPATIADGAVFDWVQQGTGQVTFTPASGATRTNINSHTKSAGQLAQGSLRVQSNNFNNTAAAYRLTGETAA